MTDPRPFHETKSLSEMSPEEWESLCDGCGKCCVVLLQDEGDDRVWRTNVGCRLLDLKTVRCTDYANRHARVPGCVALTADTVSDFYWMPDTCAYRLIAQGKPLHDWHPLVSGDPDSVKKAGIGVHGTLVSERDMDAEDFEDHIIGEQ